MNRIDEIINGMECIVSDCDSAKPEKCRKCRYHQGGDVYSVWQCKTTEIVQDALKLLFLCGFDATTQDETQEKRNKNDDNHDVFSRGFHAGDVVRHYKGKFYEIVGFSQNTETGELFVLFRKAMHEPTTTPTLHGVPVYWATPAKTFCGMAKTGEWRFKLAMRAEYHE